MRVENSRVLRRGVRPAYVLNSVSRSLVARALVGRVVKENYFLRLDEIGNIIWQFDAVEDDVEEL